MAVTDWAEKYRPRTLEEIVGNSRAVEDLRAWARRWESGVPEKERAVILAGEPGVGKTSAAHALARDMKWGVIEMNASDARNEEVIRRVAGSGAVNRAFAFDDAGEMSTGPAGRQLIILDEADNLFGAEDRGGMKAIQDIIRQTRQPIVLIANDYYELTRRGGSLKTLALTIKFTKVHSRSIPPALRRIAQGEGIALDPGVAEGIAERSGGDLRSAVNDLYAVAAGRERVTVADVEFLGTRDSNGDVWGLLGKVFYGRDLDEARKASWDLDETPDNIALWIDENLPVMYTDRADLVDGYAALSRADVYLGRVRRKQQYGLWSYASTMMTGGVALAKMKRPAGARFVFPSWLRKQSTSKAMRELRKRVAAKVSAETHTSRRVAIQEMFPLFKALMNADEEFAAWATWNLELDADELAFLLEEKATSARVKKIMAAAAAKGPARAKAAAFGGLGDYGDEDDEAAAAAAVEAGEAAKKPARAVRAKAGAAKASTDDEDAEDESAEAAPVASAKEKADAGAAKAAKPDSSARHKSLFDF